MILTISLILIFALIYFEKRNGVPFIVFTVLYPLASYLELKYLFQQDIETSYFLLVLTSLITAIATAINVFHFKNDHLEYFTPVLVFLGVNSLCIPEANILSLLVLILMFSYEEFNRRGNVLKDYLWLKILGIGVLTIFIAEGIHLKSLGLSVCLTIAMLLLVNLILRFKVTTLLATLSLLSFSYFKFEFIQHSIWVPWTLILCLMVVATSDYLKDKIKSSVQGKPVLPKLIDKLIVRNILKSIDHVEHINEGPSTSKLVSENQNCEPNDNILEVELKLMLVMAIVIFLTVTWVN